MRPLLGVGVVLLVVALTGCTASSWFRPSKPTISVSASASCPSTLGPARDVPDRSDGSATLLASGTPSAALACAYRNRGLVSQTRLGAHAAGELASVINKIDLRAPQGNFNCPAAFDSATIIAFRIGHIDDVDLWWNDSGCQTLDNGRLGGFEGANPSFYRAFLNTITRLAPAVTAHRH